MQPQDTFKLKPSLTHKFGGVIWKIEIDPADSIIAVETRNASAHTSNYSAFNFVSGECLFEDITVENSWHWGLDKVQNGFIYLHSYVTEQSPQHKGIIALDKAGKIAWQLFNKTLYDLSAEGLIAYDPNIQPPMLELLDVQTGHTLKSHIFNYNPVSREILFPSFVNDPKLLPDTLPENISGEIAFLTFNEKNIYCFHLKEGSFFTQQLLIFEGNVPVLKENLAADIQKLNPEAFFIFSSYLCCIRDEKREIVSYLV